jgi:hypothetical protein
VFYTNLASFEKKFWHIFLIQNSISMSLLIVLTIRISFLNSSSRLPFSFWSSRYSKWLIFLSVPYIWFGPWVNRINAMQKVICDNESPWNIHLSW